MEAQVTAAPMKLGTQPPARGHSEDDDMTELPRNDLDSHDWAARASEALAQARKLPAGSMRSEATRKAEQLGFAADVRKWLIPNGPRARRK
jgi:hypothetical protein